MNDSEGDDYRRVVDPDGNPILSRKGLRRKLEELGLLAAELPALNPEIMSTFDDYNGILEETNRSLKRSKPNISKKRSYFVTLTTQTSKPKGYSAFMLAVDRIMEIKGVLAAEGNFELTEQGIPHLHLVVQTTAYLDAGKVRRANHNERVDVQLLKTDKDKERVTRYTEKQVDDKKTLAVLRCATTRVSINNKNT